MTRTSAPQVIHLAVYLTCTVHAFCPSHLTPSQATVQFAPTKQQQQQCQGCETNGLDGDLLIVYDVNRPKSKGDFQVGGIDCIYRVRLLSRAMSGNNYC